LIENVKKVDQSRNINSFKMKGMASIIAEKEDQNFDTEVLEDGFLLPKKHFRQAALLQTGESSA
jgi:hypothetical protein